MWLILKDSALPGSGRSECLACPEPVEGREVQPDGNSAEHPYPKRSLAGCGKTYLEGRF